MKIRFDVCLDQQGVAAPVATAAFIRMESIGALEFRRA
jgi:hypothetical protein